MADAATTRRTKKTVFLADGVKVSRWVVKAQHEEANGEGAQPGGASAAAGGSAGSDAASDAGSAATSALTHTVAGDSDHLSEHVEAEDHAALLETAPAGSAEQIEPPQQEARLTDVTRDTVPPNSSATVA